jgi:hypothetical protein
MLRTFAALAATVAIFLCGPASAQTGSVSGHVVDIAVEWLPGSLLFRLDNTPAGCPLFAGGYWLQYAPASAEGVKAAYAAILAAEMTGRPVLLAVNGVSPSGMCLVTWLHV